MWPAGCSGALLFSILASAAAQQTAPEWVSLAQRGSSFQAAGKWSEAIESYEAAIATGAVPAAQQLAVATNLGLSLQGLGRLDEALGMFDRVLKASPANADAHHNRGVALHKAARHAEAADAFAAAVRLNPRDFESHFGRGNALAMGGDHAGAADAFAAALELNPADADTTTGRPEPTLDSRLWRHGTRRTRTRRTTAPTRSPPSGGARRRLRPTRRPSRSRRGGRRPTPTSASRSMRRAGAEPASLAPWVS